METIIDRSERETSAPDAVAFTEVVVGLEDRLVRLAALLSGGAADAEDVVAEAASRVWVRWRKGGVESLHGYLRTAVINEVHRRGRRSMLDLRCRARRSAEGRAATPVDELVTDKAAVLDALRMLGERQRLAIVLRYFEDLSVEETARLMGTSTGTVKSQVARGLRTLRSQLDPAVLDQDVGCPGGST